MTTSNEQDNKISLSLQRYTATCYDACGDSAAHIDAVEAPGDWALADTFCKSDDVSALETYAFKMGTDLARALATIDTMTRECKTLQQAVSDLRLHLAELLDRGEEA